LRAPCTIRAPARCASPTVAAGVGLARAMMPVGSRPNTERRPYHTVAVSAGCDSGTIAAKQVPRSGTASHHAARRNKLRRSLVTDARLLPLATPSSADLVLGGHHLQRFEKSRRCMCRSLSSPLGALGANRVARRLRHERGAHTDFVSCAVNEYRPTSSDLRA